jgi:hypothetical protein
MIQIFNSPKQITPERFYKDYVLQSKPCVIKNFIDPSNSCKDFYSRSDIFQEKFIGNVKTFYSNKKCLDEFFIQLSNLVDLTPNIRGWRHSSGNITQWHYDGNGINVTNICYSGSKKFYLSPPGSLQTLPLSNISIGHEKWNDNSVLISSGDMLYIPAYWFHKVETLEDNTFTINHNFYHKSNNIFSTNRDLHMYTLHQLLNTHMCSTNKICDYSKNNKNILSALVFGMYEFSWIYIILLVLIVWIYKINRLWCVYFLGLIAIICLILFFSPSLNAISSGLTKLYSFFLFIYILIAIGFIQIIK